MGTKGWAVHDILEAKLVAFEVLVKRWLTLFGVVDLLVPCSSLLIDVWKGYSPGSGMILERRMSSTRLSTFMFVGGKVYLDQDT